MSSERFSRKYRIGSNRLKGYDYSLEGAYFVTICTEGMTKNLGVVTNEKLTKNVFAEIAGKCWYDLPNHYNNCLLDEFVIMPNHIHGIIIINYPNDVTVGNVNKQTGLRPVSTEKTNRYPVSEMIRAFKSFSTGKINIVRDTKGKSFWQKNYYDRIIRNEKELDRIREYIYYNPLRWEWDKENFERSVLVRDKIKS